MKEDKTGRFKKIWDRTDEEIKNTIDAARKACEELAARTQLDNTHGDLFWTLCAGVDAYFEQRKRKEAKDSSLTTNLQPMEKK